MITGIDVWATTLRPRRVTLDSVKLVDKYLGHWDHGVWLIRSCLHTDEETESFVFFFHKA